MGKLLDTLGLIVIVSLAIWGLIACGTPECFAGSQMSQPGHCIVPGGGSAGSGGKPNVVTRVIDEGLAAGAIGHRMPMVIEADEDAGTHPSLPPKVSEGDGHEATPEAGSSVAGVGGVSAGGSGGIESEPKAVCGDGALSDGEVCDPNSKDHACPTRESCKSNGCQRAEYTGDSATCDATCAMSTITQAVSGDGCCPAGARTANDHDCRCGADSDCSGGDYCFGGECHPSACNDDGSCTEDRWCASGGTCQLRRTGLCTRDRQCPSDQKCKATIVDSVMFQQCG